LPVAVAERGKIHSVFTEQVKRHSQKPEISYQIIQRLYPDAKKLEMYSRYQRDGWDGWGNEYPPKATDLSSEHEASKQASPVKQGIVPKGEK